MADGRASDPVKMQRTARLLFVVTMVIFALFFAAAFAVAFAAYTPYAVELGVTFALRRYYWYILTPAAVLLPFVVLLADSQAKKLSLPTVVGTFAFCAPLAASTAFDGATVTGYILPACVFGIGAVELHFVLRDILISRKVGFSRRFCRIFSAVQVALSLVLAVFALRVVLGTSLVQFSMLYVAPLGIMVVPAASFCFVGCGIPDRSGVIRGLVTAAFCALYCGFCGFGVWAPYALLGVVLLNFAMSCFECVRVFTARKKEE